MQCFFSLHEWGIQCHEWTQNPQDSQYFYRYSVTPIATQLLYKTEIIIYVQLHPGISFTRFDYVLCKDL